MPSDAERFRFLEQFKLTASWDDEEFTLFWREKSVPWQYGRLYVISKGKTLAEATDTAIERYNRKHGIPPGEQPESLSGVRWLHVRGWVS
jgi:hypothetical protein